MSWTRNAATGNASALLGPRRIGVAQPCPSVDRLTSSRLIPASDPRRIFVIAALCCGGSIGGADAALQASSAAPDPAPRLERGAEPAEEVLVEGRSLAALRIQLELAEDALYARFNEINSSDDFDIHCKEEAPINSILPRRVCRPNYLRNAYAQAGREVFLWLTGSPFSTDSEQYMSEALRKGQLLDEEMRKLAAEDEQLLQAVIQFVDIKQALEGRASSAALQRSTAAERTPEQGALPYDAARIVDVAIGRAPWSGELRHGAFTIAHVFGKIRSIELDCDGRKTQLRWKPRAEWRLPKNRESCSVRVEARPSSSFALYEFE